MHNCAEPPPHHEIASLLARVLYRIVTRQNVAPQRQDCLDVLPKEVLSVTTKTVNNHGDTGDA
jgi:hypothetical protein